MPDSDFKAGVHANDSKTSLGSRVDRHEYIGKGKIGNDWFRRLIHNLKFQRIPFILETPIINEHDDRLNLHKLRDPAGVEKFRSYNPGLKS